jgi:hypothetical protein
MHDVDTYTPTPVPASVYVACPSDWCTAFAVQRLVWLPQVALGVVAVPRLLCQACHSALYVPLWPDLEETPMPKLHADREPTNKHDIQPWRPMPGGHAADVVADPEADAAPAETAETAETPTVAKKAAPRKAARAKAGDGS